MENNIDEPRGREPLLGIIGDNIQYSLSPHIQNLFIDFYALPLRYQIFDFSISSLSDFLKNFRKSENIGFNVTIPYKEKIIPYLDELDVSAQKAGAVNTVLVRDKSFIGYNTDGFGLIQAINSLFLQSSFPTKTIIWGYGGAAKGIAYSIAEEGCNEFVFVGRNQSKFVKLKDQLLRQFPQVNCQFFSIQIDNTDNLNQRLFNFSDTNTLLINTIPVDVPIVMKGFPGKICDIRYRNNYYESSDYAQNQKTLVSQSIKEGIPFIDGLPMLVYQAAKSFSIWFGKNVPSYMLERIINHLSM